MGPCPRGALRARTSPVVTTMARSIGNSTNAARMAVGHVIGLAHAATWLAQNG